MSSWHGNDHVTMPLISVFTTVPKNWVVKFSIWLGKDSQRAELCGPFPQGLLQPSCSRPQKSIGFGLRFPLSPQSPQFLVSPGIRPLEFGNVELQSRKTPFPLKFFGLTFRFFLRPPTDPD